MWPNHAWLHPKSSRSHLKKLTPLATALLISSLSNITGDDSNCQNKSLHSYDRVYCLNKGLLIVVKARWLSVSTMILSSGRKLHNQDYFILCFTKLSIRYLNQFTKIRLFCLMYVVFSYEWLHS